MRRFDFERGWEEAVKLCLPQLVVIAIATWFFGNCAISGELVWGFVAIFAATLTGITAVVVLTAAASQAAGRLDGPKQRHARRVCRVIGSTLVLAVTLLGIKATDDHVTGYRLVSSVKAEFYQAGDAARKNLSHTDFDDIVKKRDKVLAQQEHMVLIGRWDVYNTDQDGGPVLHCFCIYMQGTPRKTADKFH